MEFHDSDRERRMAEAIEKSVCTATIVVKQLQNDEHGEMYMVLEPEDQNVSPSEMIKILEMAKIDAMRKMGVF